MIPGRSRFGPILIFLLVGLLALPPGGDAAHAVSQPAECQVLVKLRAETGLEEARAFLADSGLQPLRLIPRIDVWVAACTPAEGRARSAGRLAELPGVQWAEPDAEVRAAEIIPNDPYFLPQQYNLRQIGLPMAWTITTGDRRPIAIVDTSVDLTHPDLASKIWTNPGEIPGNGLDDDGNGYVDDVHGWDFYNYDSDPDLDPLGDSTHGTQVAGVAAAATHNGIGVAGISWQSPVMALRVLGPSQTGTYSAVADALIYAADNGARVMNMSLGGPERSETLNDAVDYVLARGGLPVASAGNSGEQGVLYPAALPGVLAVAAVTSSDVWATFSNYGEEVDIAAPGMNIFTTSTIGYSAFSGTSAAAPHISGAAALVWAAQPGWSAQQVAGTLTGTARDVGVPGWDEKTGWGRVDAYAAVLTARPPVSIYVPTFYHQKVGEAYFLPFVAGSSSAGAYPAGQ